MNRHLTTLVAVVLALLPFAASAQAEDEDFTIPCGWETDTPNSSVQLGAGPWVKYVVETRIKGIPCQIGAFAEGNVGGVGGSAIRGEGVFTGTATREVMVPSYGNWVTNGIHSRGSIFGEWHVGNTLSSADVLAPEQKEEEESPTPDNPPEECVEDWSVGVPFQQFPFGGLGLLALGATLSLLMWAAMRRTPQLAWAMAVAAFLFVGLASGTEANEDPCWGYSPLLLDQQGNGFQLTTAEKGVHFDIDADGTLEKVSWTRPNSDDAWLAIDRNGNGVIDSGAELFGNHTPVYQGGPVVTAGNGFDALRFLEGITWGGGVSDTVLDARDAAFGRLLLWVDSNHNGVSEPGELTDATQSSLVAISLNYREESTTKKDYTVRQRSQVQWAGGITTDIVDVWLHSTQR